MVCFVKLIVCNNNSNDYKSMWSKAQIFYSNKDFNNCIVLLDNILNNCHDEDLLVKSYFLTSEIYLNEYKEFDISISFLDEILERYPDHTLYKRSLFTKSYILANYLESYTDAINLYSLFIKKFPDDELVSSVHYELKELDKYRSKINSMTN